MEEWLNIFPRNKPQDLTQDFQKIYKSNCLSIASLKPIQKNIYQQIKFMGQACVCLKPQYQSQEYSKKTQFSLPNPYEIKIDFQNVPQDIQPPHVHAQNRGRAKKEELLRTNWEGNVLKTCKEDSANEQSQQIREDQINIQNVPIQDPVPHVQPNQIQETDHRGQSIKWKSRKNRGFMVQNVQRSPHNGLGALRTAAQSEQDQASVNEQFMMQQR